MGARSTHSERNQDISVSIDDPRDSLVGLDSAGIRIAIRELKRQSIGNRCADARRQHPSEINLVSTRNDSPRSGELHTGFADIDIRDADASADERAEGSEPRQTQLRQVHIGGKHAGQGGQPRRDLLPTLSLQKVCTTGEGESRTVLKQGLNPQGRQDGVAEPKLEARPVR